jgi:predicted transcriptional regulator
MKRKDIKVSDSELELLRHLWDEAPLGATELAERVAPERGWSLTTVKTLLSRLVGKGAVAAERDGRRYLYRPLLEKDALASRQVGGLIDRLFGGRVSPLVAQLAEQREIDPEDIAELERIIRSLKS